MTGGVTEDLDHWTTSGADRGCRRYVAAATIIVFKADGSARLPGRVAGG